MSAPQSAVVRMSPVKAIRTFFEADGGRKVNMEELKTLPLEDRRELAALAAAQLGVELDLQATA